MYFAFNPIIVTVQAPAFPTGATNCVVILSVTISKTYKFKHLVTSGQSVYIDVSSAFRAELLELGYPTSGSTSSPSKTGTLSAIAQYVLEADVLTSQTAPTVSDTSITARFGRYTGTQLLDMNSVPEAPATLSLKPLGELPTTPNQRTFKFLNQYGEVESATVTTLAELHVNIKTDTVGQSYGVGKIGRPHSRALHTGGTDSLKLSTGYLTRDWLSWFAHDFLMSNYHWILVGSTYIPVIVTPDEQSSIYDRSTGELKAIGFTAQAAIDGASLI